MFYDSDQFAFVKVLECEWEAIHDEYRRARPELEDWVERKLYNQGWQVLGLYDFPHGAPIAAHVELCARTADLVHAHVPRHGAVAFSVLRPGTRIHPHQGYQGEFLRCHLALEVPAGDCALEVAGESRCWSPGRALVFDDRVRHRAWNLTAAERVVLLVDFVPD